jgi:hypothetical protein
MIKIPAMVISFLLPLFASFQFVHMIMIANRHTEQQQQQLSLRIFLFVLSLPFAQTEAC